MAQAVAIKARHFEGGKNLSESGHRVDATNNEELAQILRNFVEQVKDRIQSGVAKIAGGAASATITLSPAMPDTNYDVICTLREAGTGKAVGPAVLDNLFVPDADKAVGSFKVHASPVGNVTEDVDFYWLARSRTHLNTKA